jgi:hypothetical protein
MPIACDLCLLWRDWFDWFVFSPMKNKVTKKDEKELGKLVAFMVKNPDAAFGIYENEVFRNGVRVCVLSSHGQALRAIKATRDAIESHSKGVAA